MNITDDPLIKIHIIGGNFEWGDGMILELDILGIGNGFGVFIELFSERRIIGVIEFWVLDNFLIFGEIDEGLRLSI